LETIKGTWKTRKVFIDGKELLPAESQAIFNHSPDGFMWGYGGSGPAQLALAILLKMGLEDRVAVKLHQKFKFHVIAKFPQNSDFEIDLEKVETWIVENYPAEWIEEERKLDKEFGVFGNEYD
jgi:hypothetical protein